MTTTVTVVLHFSDDDVRRGWFGDTRTPDEVLDELSLSVQARLDEVYGDDGGAYVPDVQVLNVNRVED